MRLLFVSVILLLTACTTSPEKQFHSGYLSDYTVLKTVDVDDDSELQRFISDKIKTRGYTQVMLDPISYYPAPQVTDTKSSEALADISHYINKTFTNAIASKVSLVSNPGKKTLRIKMAITAVDVVDKELKGIDYIPIAFLFNAAKGGLNDMDVKFQIETEVVDALSGEVLASAVKTGVGVPLDNEESQLKLDNLKPLIDSWSKTLVKTLVENM
mgnify:CR=1 FL=1